MPQSADMPDHAASPDRLVSIAEDVDRISLELVGGEEGRRQLTEMLRGYAIPRRNDPSDTVVVAVVGPSGAGKSTLVNSIARRRVSPQGVVRPTTTTPVAWCDGALPPTMDRLRARFPGRIVDAFRPPPDGVVVVDTPPPSVVDEEGRSVAEQIMAVADACLYVVSGLRYADAGALGLLDTAAARSVPVSFVINRLPATTELQGLLVEDMATKLADQGHLPRAAPELVIPVSEGPVSEETGGLPAEWVSGVRKELESLADPQSRAAMVAANLTAVDVAVADGLRHLRGAVIDVATMQVELLDPVLRGYEIAADDLSAGLASGGFAELARSPAEMVTGLAAVVTRRAGRAARTGAEIWAAHPVGSTLVAADPTLFTHGPGMLEEARGRLRWWLDELPGLAAEYGRRWRKRTRRRLAGVVWRLALDPGLETSRRDRRRLRSAPGIVESARSRLAEELAGLLEMDASRFVSAAGPPVPSGLLARLDLADGS